MKYFTALRDHALVDQRVSSQQYQHNIINGPLQGSAQESARVQSQDCVSEARTLGGQKNSSHLFALNFAAHNVLGMLVNCSLPKINHNLNFAENVLEVSAVFSSHRCKCREADLRSGLQHSSKTIRSKGYFTVSRAGIRPSYSSIRACS